MGTEVLRPQDCLADRMRVRTPILSRKSYVYNPNTNQNPKSKKRVVPRSQVSLISKKSVVDDVKPERKNMVMGQVTILKRGESLDSKKKIKNIENHQKKFSSEDEVVFGTERLGPDPEMVPKLMVSPIINGDISRSCEIYAGSGFYVSPSPSSLPLPSFNNKKKSQLVIDDSATKSLRQLLGLN